MATGQAAGTSERVTADSLLIRKCHELDEIRACVALQKEVWNFTDLELVPLRMFVVAEKVGGQVIGAFDGKEIVGFALSIPGARGGHSYLHSHMLADRNRSQFLAAFADGICVLGYERHPEGNGRFLLGKWDENWLYEA